MPFTPVNPLCALADVKEALHISDSTDDNQLNWSIDTASRQIEGALERRFYQDSTTSARVYTAQTPFTCKVDDFADTADLLVESLPFGVSGAAVAWTSADYQLEPLNGLLGEQPWPYTGIRAVRSLLFPVYGGIAYPLPYVQALVRITTKWGWSYIPTPIQRAALLQTIFLNKAKDVPLGASPFSESGVIRLRGIEFHPTAAALMEPYYKEGVLVL